MIVGVINNMAPKYMLIDIEKFRRIYTNQNYTTNNMNFFNSAICSQMQSPLRLLLHQTRRKILVAINLLSFDFSEDHQPLLLN
jgi:hypothetical protein